ncbi:MAG TPA: DUF4013 domain-containing protein [Methanobacteriaceae archaeon]|nr:DUF4013 domain-containing protein [Methanobacteriaceae archaeon]
MDVDQIICKSLEYPRKSWGKVAILGAILIVPFLLLVLLVFLGILANNAAVIVIMAILGILLAIVAGILIYGYLFRVIKATIAGMDDLPNFDDFGDMVVGGLKVLVVQIIYGLIFGIIAAIPIGIVMLVLGLSGALSPTTFTDPAAFLGAGLFMWVMYLAIFLLYLVLLVIGILYLIVVPMGIANMAYLGNIGSAFAFSDLRQKIESIRWGKAIVWVIATQFVFTVAVLISYILGLLLVGIILIPLLVIPFMVLFYARSIGLLYRND